MSPPLDDSPGTTSALTEPWLKVMQAAIEGIEDAGAQGADDAPYDDSISAIGLPVGLMDLDSLTGGLSAGELWVVTGASGAGKSVLASEIARAAAVRNGASTAVVLRTETAASYAMRVVSAEAAVTLRAARLGVLSDDDWTRMARRMSAIGAAPLHVAALDRASDDWAAVLCETALVAGAHAARVVVVDDLPSTVPADAAATLKQLARRIGATVVVTVRDDLGSTEAFRTAALGTADVVLQIVRPNGEPAHEAELRVVRHRRGPTAAVTVEFQGFYSRFLDMRGA